MTMRDMEGYEDLMDLLLKEVPAEHLMDKVVETVPAEQVLSHYGPEQRLAGLDRDHQALALPIEVLRLLPESYVASLSAEVQAEIRRRLSRAGD